ncbi:MAG: hypothetical protein AB1775_09755 [Bacteroidota bacterium]
MSGIKRYKLVAVIGFTFFIIALIAGIYVKINHPELKGVAIRNVSNRNNPLWAVLFAVAILNLIAGSIALWKLKTKGKKNEKEEMKQN